MANIVLWILLTVLSNCTAQPGCTSQSCTSDSDISSTRSRSTLTSPWRGHAARDKRQAMQLEPGSVYMIMYLFIESIDPDQINVNFLEYISKFATPLRECHYLWAPCTCTI